MLRYVVIFAAIAGPVAAHDWYPQKCCSDYDCAPAEVAATPDGWRVESGGQIVAYDDPRIKPTPPEGGNEFHVCTRGGKPDGEVLCLFVPEFGA